MECRPLHQTLAYKSLHLGKQFFKLCGVNTLRAVFPVGLLLIIVCGSELITGNFAMLTPGFFTGKIKWHVVLRCWGVVYVGNFVGSTAVSYFLAYQTELFSKEPWLSGVQDLAEAKVSLRWSSAFLSGIGCNWLVCLSVVMCVAAKTLTCKMVAIWFPIQV